nr:TPA_asm: hypothetical protein HUJ06_024238 [Nelumbo nucifera]
MVQHFSPVFKPIQSSNDGAIDQSRPGLSLWMNQGSQSSQALMNNNLPELHQIGSAGLGTLFATDPLISSCSNIPSQMDYPVNWDFGNKLSSTNTGELTSTSLPLTNLKEVGSPRFSSAPSLYSTQHHHNQLPPPIMSATALLQKAAAIGSTWNEPSFLESFGVKCNNSQVVQDGNKYNGLFAPNSVPTNLTTDLENSASDLSSMNNQLQMYPRKRQNTQKDDTEGGQTRDFLGVGVHQTICPSTINGWI